MKEIQAAIFKPKNYMPVDSTSQLLRCFSAEFKDNTVCAKTKGGELIEIIVGEASSLDARVVNMAKTFNMTYRFEKVMTK